MCFVIVGEICKNLTFKNFESILPLELTVELVGNWLTLTELRPGAQGSVGAVYCPMITEHLSSHSVDNLSPFLKIFFG